VESVTKRMRWKANIFLKGSATQNQSNFFGLSSNKSPPSIPLLKPVEDDLIKLIEDVNFRRSKDQFQTSLAHDLKKVNSINPNIFIFADKTRKIYETSLNIYNELLHDNITKTYKHGSEDFIDEVDSSEKTLSIYIFKRSQRKFREQSKMQIN
jgi:hypothetical protein